MKAVRITVCSLAALILAGCAGTRTTEWINLYPVAAEPTFQEKVYGPEDVYLRDYELGLRSDGVLMWRARETE